jgi:hypothetical protein
MRAPEKICDDLPRVDNVINALQEADSSDEILIGNFSISSSEGSMNYFHGNNLERVALNPGLWRMVFRSKLVREIRFAPRRMGEDQLFIVKLNLGSRKVKFSENFFYVYFRGHPTQLTSLDSARNEVTLVLDAIRVAIEENPILENRYSEIIKSRLFLTFIKNQRSDLCNIAKINKFRKQYRISLKSLCLVLTKLLMIKFVQSIKHLK